MSRRLRDFVTTYTRDLKAEDLGRLFTRDAREAYERAQTIMEKLSDDYSAVAVYKQDLAAIYNNLGVLLRKMNKPAEAKAATCAEWYSAASSALDAEPAA